MGLVRRGLVTMVVSGAVLTSLIISSQGEELEQTVDDSRVH